METSSLNSEEMELQQMQLDERELHQKCLTRRLLLQYLEEFDKLVDETVFKYEELRIKESEVQTIKEIENRLKESELQQQESLVEGATLEANLSTDDTVIEACLITEGVVIEACLVTEGATLEVCLVSEGITLNDNTGVMENSRTGSKNSSIETPFSRSKDETRSSDKERSSSEGYDTNDDIGPSYDSDTVSEVPHDMFENVFTHGIQCHEQPESIPDTYVVNENNSNVIFDIPNMDPDRNKEEHDDGAYEQQRAFFESLINNLKCDVEKCNEINREAQQANALLTNELERYKEKEKHLAKDMTIESEYCKKIKLLNDEISNLKSQACEKDKTFVKENEKNDELRKAGQTDQTLRMLLPKKDNV
ncbi:hypothetical protein Tco_0588769 [Tanacetum coccineum]